VAVTSPFGGRLSDAWGRRPLSLIGAALALVGALMLLAGMRGDISSLYLAASLAVIGVGLGLGIGPAQTAAVESAPHALAGSASGTSSMMRYAGSIIGAGVLAGVLHDGGASEGDVDTFRLVTLAVVVTAALAVAVSVFIHRFPDPEIRSAGDQQAR
jgi:MFS family permease